MFTLVLLSWLIPAWLSNLSREAWIGIVFGLIGVAVGVAYGSIEHRRFSNQEKELSAARQELTDLQRELKMVEECMSTRFVGLFPDNMRAIVDVCEKANSEILVMGDYVVYGAYSNPPLFFQYWQSLEKAVARNAAVKILHYDDDSTKKSLRVQFKEAEFEIEMQKERFTRFFSRYKVPMPTTHAGFIEALTEIQKKLESALLLLNKVETRVTAEQFAFFLWIEDSAEGVFAFNNRDVSHQRGYSFQTRDGNLIANYRELFSRRWETARPAPPPCPEAAKAASPS